MSSPYKSAKDSPSKQLLWELGQKARLEQELFYAHLDRENDEREALHRQALAAASAEHDRVRRNAEQYREQLERQIQADRARREEETQQEIEKLRKAKAEQEIAASRREAERAKAEEADQKRLAELKQLQDAEAGRRKLDKERQDAEAALNAQRLKQQADERLKREQEAKAVEARAKEAAILSETSSRAALHTNPTIPANQQLAPIPGTTRNQQWEAEHQSYLEIHQRLKDLRKFMTAQAKQSPELKRAMGDMRREMKKSVGQLREGKGANKIPLQTIINTLKKATALAEPQIDVTMFLASSPPQVGDRNGPALLVYLLNIFAKAIVAQFIDEAGVKPLISDPLGTVASHIFAIGNFRWKGISLIDILIAKMHVVCPILFGIYGDEGTNEGKQRLGWWRDEKNGPFVPEQRHFERMTGLGAGFAGISLRNYEKAQAQNPYPDQHYWQAFSRIVNVPQKEISQTHFVVLKGLIENYESKFLNFYGDAAIAALRLALIELPMRSAPTAAAKALSGLVDMLKKEKKIAL